MSTTTDSIVIDRAKVVALRDALKELLDVLDDSLKNDVAPDQTSKVKGLRTQVVGLINKAGLAKKGNVNLADLDPESIDGVNTELNQLENANRELIRTLEQGLKELGGRVDKLEKDVKSLADRPATGADSLPVFDFLGVKSEKGQVTFTPDGWADKVNKNIAAIGGQTQQLTSQLLDKEGQLQVVTKADIEAKVKEAQSALQAQVNDNTARLDGLGVVIEKDQNGEIVVDANGKPIVVFNDNSVLHFSGGDNYSSVQDILGTGGFVAILVMLIVGLVETFVIHHRLDTAFWTVLGLGVLGFVVGASIRAALLRWSN